MVIRNLTTGERQVYRDPAAGRCQPYTPKRPVANAWVEVSNETDVPIRLFEDDGCRSPRTFLPPGRDRVVRADRLGAFMALG